ncbi:MAG TPA: phosphatase PAP2 family protein [Candidatus Eisenbacteria bacterium]|nr:phosphatase PAP2 family protein [Candidatus Eisenbacteria bacterium]
MSAARRGTSGARPVDWMLGGYNALAAVIWLFALGRRQAASWIVAAHALGALAPWAAPAMDRGTSRVLRAAREAYPLLLLYPFYAEVGLFHAAMGAAGHDASVLAWDRALFSVNWHRACELAMPAAWLREAMHASYFSYYLLIALPPIVAALLRRWPAFRAISFRMMLTYVVCYAIYFAYPAFGPMHADPESAVAAARATPDGFFSNLVRAAAESGDSPGTAFPSSHVAGALTAAWLGFRWHARWVAWAQLALAGLVALSTVYTGNHYAIDALAGILLAVVLQGFVAPRLEGGRREEGA